MQAPPARGNTFRCSKAEEQYIGLSALGATWSSPDYRNQNSSQASWSWRATSWSSFPLFSIQTVTPDQNCGKCERGFVLWMFNPMFPNCEIWKQQQEFLSGRLYLPACTDGHNVPHQIDPVYKMFCAECTQGDFLWIPIICFLIICDPVTYVCACGRFSFSKRAERWMLWKVRKRFEKVWELVDELGWVWQEGEWCNFSKFWCCTSRLGLLPRLLHQGWMAAAEQLSRVKDFHWNCWERKAQLLLLTEVPSWKAAWQ